MALRSSVRTDAQPQSKRDPGQTVKPVTVGVLAQQTDGSQRVNHIAPQPNRGFYYNDNTGGNDVYYVPIGNTDTNGNFLISDIVKWTGKPGSILPVSIYCIISGSGGTEGTDAADFWVIN